MRDNKNILKRKYKSGMAEVKHVKQQKFYAIIEVEVEVTVKQNKTVKSFVREVEGTRLQAKNELKAFAKSVNGKITHFGGFKN